MIVNDGEPLPGQSPPVPTGRQIGEYIGAHLPSQVRGKPKTYELTCFEPDGMDITYRFIPTGDEGIALFSISVSGKSPALAGV